MGVYPYLCCSHWGELRQDFDALGDKLVAITVIADPLGNYDPELLARTFDRVRAYKPHYVIDNSIPVAQRLKRSHREKARRALRSVSVALVDDPGRYTDDWIRLYDVLCQRHRIVGLRRFTAEALRQQLSVPGLVMFRAQAAGATVGLNLWYVQDDAAHDHLSAVDEDGYRLRASYAMKMALIEHFHSRVAWINLGSSLIEGDGLAAFKSGWATGTRMSWFCGSVLNAQAYNHLNECWKTADDGSYFPAYRRNMVF
jgi:hypothetical protein